MLNQIVEAKSVTVQHMGRQAWYSLRCERFLSRILIYDWTNLTLCAGVMLGVYCASRIRTGNKRNAWWMLGLALITFFDVVTYSSVWLSYANYPSGPYLYRAPSWMPELKKQVKEGSVAICNPAQDLDFILHNHLSTFGVRLSDGYETVRQHSIRPLAFRKYEAGDYALAGISHILCDTKWKQPSLPGWSLVMVEKEFNLYENPLYSGRYLSDSGERIIENWRTYNKISLQVPPKTKQLTILESYHRGWTALVEGKELQIVPTERGGMCISLPETDTSYELQMEFHMPYRMWYYSVMAFIALLLLVMSVQQYRGAHDQKQKLLAGSAA